MGSVFVGRSEIRPIRLEDCFPKEEPVTREDLARTIYRGYFPHQPPSAYDDSLFKRDWLRAADAAAKALGVSLDQPGDPRYAVAERALYDADYPWSTQARESIARAIVAAIAENNLMVGTMP